MKKIQVFLISVITSLVAFSLSAADYTCVAPANPLAGLYFPVEVRISHLRVRGETTFSVMGIERIMTISAIVVVDKSKKEDSEIFPLVLEFLRGSYLGTVEQEDLDKVTRIEAISFDAPEDIALKIFRLFEGPHQVSGSLNISGQSTACL